MQAFRGYDSRAAGKKQYKYLHRMDEVFGAQHNIVPPVIMEPGRTELALHGGTKRSAAAASAADCGANQTAAETTEDTKGASSSISGSASPHAAVLIHRPREDHEKDSVKRHKADMEL
ncbi:hypothetical protein GN244_ATG08507 [Phytophthora infestans]|uniref:Uncharacterized protein n=1 Tax=Phytophthora infestans TaxID=4787 RepID=A0A833SVC0_PHYIN|nr:hypothetical protein GN244_ATG08507 [Phytophthora infestans]